MELQFYTTGLGLLMIIDNCQMFFVILACRYVPEESRYLWMKWSGKFTSVSLLFRDKWMRGNAVQLDEQEAPAVTLDIV